ncbi:hypothetical protein [Microbulbifer sp. Q7]|uniref:hypothetical protein n=1 Tax=Microbulbifer sp. Q7 TaxID=1785091 RepID=UPI0008335771|nr:hypothetical protein [Microbulbifer sp. Q7]
MRKIEEYTIRELQEAIVGIDQAKNPEKYAELQAEISRKRARVNELNSQISELYGSSSESSLGGDSVNQFTFKRCFLACLCSIGAFWVLIGLLGIFGLGTVTANGEQVHGMKALVTAVFGGGFSSLILAFMVWAGEKVLRLFENA